MSSSELAAVEALLERVLPDPRGFAERVYEQMMERLSPGLHGGDLAPSGSPAADVLADRSILFAAAVGACECWGEDPECPVCRGNGSPGWTTPDAQLYAEYVEPAVHRSTEGKSAGDGTRDEPPAEGVSA